MNAKQMRCALAVVAAVAVRGLSAGEPSDEELYGERIYFRLGDKFETGNLLDYFTVAPPLAELFRNLHGYNGYCVRSHYGNTRPIKVEGGKTYRLTFKAYNEGMENGYLHPTNNTVFPDFRFLDGTYRLKDASDWWKTVPKPRGWKAEGQVIDRPPAAAWKDYAITFTVPEGATMMTIGFCRIHGKKSEWGSYCVAEIDMKEVR